MDDPFSCLLIFAFFLLVFIPLDMHYLNCRRLKKSIKEKMVSEFRVTSHPNLVSLINS